MQQYLFKSPPKEPYFFRMLKRHHSANPWADLDKTPLGRLVNALIQDWEKAAATVAANDNHLFWGRNWLDQLMIARARLVDGYPIPRAQRQLIYRIAWINRSWLPPDLALYAAIGGGCGDE